MDGGPMLETMTGSVVSNAETVLRTDNLDVGYGKLKAARALELHVAAGEVVALIGANGVGKTTTLLTLAGVIPALGGRVLWQGLPTTDPLHVMARKGLAFIPEEKSVVPSLSVKDNLRLGGASPAAAVELFPELGRLLGRKAGLLSGGEQQILALARALVRLPRAVIVDELSLGLAPIVADRLVQALRQAAADRVAVLVVEQNLRRALALADRFYLMRGGRIELCADADDFRDRVDELERMLVGTTGSPGPEDRLDSREGA
jgi:branched-chain amino acid transport system ATP-binding protein